MKLSYTEHALQRLKERGITKKEVLDAFNKGSKSDAEGGLRQIRHRSQKGMLVVKYIIQSKSEVRVITAYRQ